MDSKGYTKPAAYPGTHVDSAIDRRGAGSTDSHSLRVNYTNRDDEGEQRIQRMRDELNEKMEKARTTRFRLMMLFHMLETLDRDELVALAYWHALYVALHA